MPRPLRFAAAVLVLLAPGVSLATTPSLLEARGGHETKLTKQLRETEPLGEPRAELFSLVKVPTPTGEMSAWLGVRPEGEGRHPAILWVTGGFPPGGIGSSAWTAQPAANDQSAKDYRLAGLVMMYPTFRGSFGNPGVQESFYGEVDDLLAALQYLKTVDHVDPDRIFLGGHSTGGTLAMLAAAATDEFRAVLAFGPVSDPIHYGSEVLAYDPGVSREARLRAPIRFLDAIRSPTFVIEGEHGNSASLLEMREASRNPLLKTILLPGLDHFEPLAASNRLIASRLAALGPGEPLQLEAKELLAAHGELFGALREADDLHAIARARARGVSLTEPVRVVHYCWAEEAAPLRSLASQAAVRGYEVGEIEKRRDDEGETYHLVRLTRSRTLGRLDEVFAASKFFAELAPRLGAVHDGWTTE